MNKITFIDEQKSLGEEFWRSTDSVAAYNFSAPGVDRETLRALLQSIPLTSDSLLIATSGTTRGAESLRFARLSRKAMLCSAKAVNLFLESSAEDVWLRCLPLFHVGGLSIHARAFLGENKVIVQQGAWSAKNFLECIKHEGVTLTSLVPAQVYDLVTEQLKSPASLRAVVVGGGALAPSLYEKGRAAGWPLLPSYGLTECSSQVATAPLSSLGANATPGLEVLPHVKISVDEEGIILLQSEALLSEYLEIAGGKAVFHPATREGWYSTGDKGELQQGVLTIQGRKGEFIKIGGEALFLGELDQLLSALAGREAPRVALTALPDERLGHKICLCAEKEVEIVALIEAFNREALPIARIREAYAVEFIPRTPLGKVIRGALQEGLSSAKRIF